MVLLSLSGGVALPVGRQYNYNAFKGALSLTNLYSLTVSERVHISCNFWPSVDTSGGPNACWEWIGVRNKDGYGTISFKGKTLLTHRLSCALSSGTDVTAEMVCHACDNPPCVNPKHIWLGDRMANVQDMMEKRYNGQYEPLFDISPDAIRQIRARVANGESQSVIAREFNASRSTIWDIVHLRYRWAMID